MFTVSRKRLAAGAAGAAAIAGVAVLGATPSSPATASTPTATAAASRTVAVTISGGHETEARDRGRPDVLVAAGLGVPTAVFREAFSAVHPAGAGEEPGEEQVQENKAALLRVLAPYGVTNELLDTVSNYYRYNGAAGETWPQVAAKAKATVRGGRVVSVRVVSGGSGYSSAPTLTVRGVPGAKLKATIAYGTVLEENGRLAKVSVR